MFPKIKLNLLIWANEAYETFYIILTSNNEINSTIIVNIKPFSVQHPIKTILLIRNRHQSIYSADFKISSLYIDVFWISRCGFLSGKLK